MPAARSVSAPPPESVPGSRAATTTRAIFAAMIALAHGGVLPVWLHGSSVTYIVAPRAALPARASALTSACASPYRSCQPSPTISPSRTTTAPTSGLGEVCPQPRSASASARRMNCSSRASVMRSDSESNAKCAVGLSRAGGSACERVVRWNVDRVRAANLANELDDWEVERRVQEVRRAGELLLHGYRAERLARCSDASHATCSDVAASGCAGAVPILSHTRCEAEHEETLARNQPVGIGADIDVLEIQRVAAAVVGCKVDCWKAAMQIRDRDPGEQYALLNDSNAHAAAEFHGSVRCCDMNAGRIE